MALLGAGACDSEGGVKREALRGTGGGGQNVVLIVVDTRAYPNMVMTLPFREPLLQPTFAGIIPP